MKIRTKAGDKGYTSLFEGERVPKHHARIEAYGTIDELVAFTALLREQAGMEHYLDWLTRILDQLMRCGSTIASIGTCKPEMDNPLLEEDVNFLENGIDEMDGELEPLTGFIIPGGHQTIALCHVARTVCRRAERKVVGLSALEAVPEITIRYLNCLSDYLFTLSRHVAKKLGVEQIYWKPEV